MQDIKLQLEEEKLIRYIIRNLKELKQLLEKIKEVEQEDYESSILEIKKSILSILRSTKGSIFKQGEIRTEYAIANQYSRLCHIFQRYSSLLSEVDYIESKKLIDKTSILNSQLNKLGSENGEIVRALFAASKNPSENNLKKVEELISLALEIDNSFELSVIELLKKTKEIKTTKSSLLALENYQDLALMQTYYYGHNYLILFNVHTLESELKESLDIFERLYSKDIEAENEFQRRIQVSKKINRVVPHPREDDPPHKLSYLELQILDKCIIGFCELVPFSKNIFLGSYQILRIATKKGYGPFFCELIFAFAAKRKKPVILDRHNTTPSIRKVFEYFDFRKDIIKYPSALAKYPELIGFTKKEALEKFGTQGVYYSSSFNGYGLPENTPKELQSNLLGRNYERFNQASYHESEGFENKVIGGTVSLDKAYFCDREIKLYDSLIIKSKKVVAENLIKEYLIFAGSAFFQSFNPNNLTK